MRARQVRGTLVLAIVASALGCARNTQPGSDAPMIQQVATARITNNNFLDITVYAARAGSRQRLGTVTGQNTQVFQLPRQLIDARGLRIFIDPIGSSQSYETELISLGPGQQLDLVVQQRLAMSHYSVVDP
jgi:hypothetical protein